MLIDMLYGGYFSDTCPSDTCCLPASSQDGPAYSTGFVQDDKNTDHVLLKLGLFIITLSNNFKHFSNISLCFINVMP